MAKATAICTCKTCGETFRKTVTRNTRADADGWEVWAKDNCDTCPDCYRKKKVAEEIAMVNELKGLINLPELTGTEKQIDYANKLIFGYLKYNAPVVQRYAVNRNGFDNLTAEKAAKMVEKYGMSVEEIEKNFFSQPYFDKLIKILETTSAGKIIDLLKR